MKPDEFFEFDPAEYAKATSKHDTRHLKQQEIVKTRQTLKASMNIGAGAVGAVMSGGVTAIHPLYASRQSYIAETKLKIIQAELTKRGIPLHRADNGDGDAAVLGFLAGTEVGVELDEGLLAHGVTETALQHEITNLAAGDVAEDATAEITDKLPKKRGRLKLKKYCRLSCGGCGKHFDSSFTEYLRE
jgi:hypothetical protein